MTKKIMIMFLVLASASCQVKHERNQDVSLKRLDIMYTNDLHANLEPMLVMSMDSVRRIGGFANISSKVKHHKADNEHTLYLDAGDWFTGPAYSSLTKGRAVVEVMNTMGLDAACVGNHEFDHGGKNLQEQLAKATFPVVNANIYVDSTGKLLCPSPWVILERNDLKIGVIGLHGKFAFYDTVADTMTRGLDVKDEVSVLAECVDSLRPRVDLVILLVHEGIPGRQSSMGSKDVARGLKKDIELAQQVDGIDVLITGHTHLGTPEPLVSKGTLIVSTDALGLEVGCLELVFDMESHKIVDWKNHLDVLYDDEWPDDSLTAAGISFWRDSLTMITSRMAGTIRHPLTRSYGEESSLGGRVADALLASWPDADMAFINSGGLRDDIAAGDVTVGDVIAAFPFPNTVVRLELRGDDVLQAMEHSASLSNGIMQVSQGILLRIDTTRSPGNRVMELKLNGIDIDPSAMYHVVTNNFVADGGDGYVALTRAKSYLDTGVPVLDVLIEDFNRNIPENTAYNRIKIVR